MHRSRPSPRWAAAVAAIALVGSLGNGAARAQDGSGVEASRLVAALHAGSCDALGEPVSPLEPITVGEGVTDERVGAAAAAAAAMSYSISDLDVAFDDLLATPHAIIVSADGDNPLACGEIGGYVDDDGLILGLTRADAAGLAGMAVLWDDDDAVELELYVAQDLDATVGR